MMVTITNLFPAKTEAVDAATDVVRPCTELSMLISGMKGELGVTKDSAAHGGRWDGMQGALLVPMAQQVVQQIVAHESQDNGGKEYEEHGYTVGLALLEETWCNHQHQDVGGGATIKLSSYWEQAHSKEIILVVYKRHIVDFFLVYGSNSVNISKQALSLVCVCVR